MTDQEYKAMSVKEFTKAAEIYDSGHAGVYEICKDDYPPVLEELKNYPFDVVICTNSFHHYPNPQAFMNEASRVLKTGGKLILRDYTSNKFIVWFMNHIELPLAHFAGHGDVRIHSCEEVRKMCQAAGLKVKKLDKQKGFRMHLVAEKRV